MDHGEIVKMRYRAERRPDRDDQIKGEFTNKPFKQCGSPKVKMLENKSRLCVFAGRFKEADRLFRTEILVQEIEVREDHVYAVVPADLPDTGLPFAFTALFGTGSLLDPLPVNCIHEDHRSRYEIQLCAVHLCRIVPECIHSGMRKDHKAGKPFCERTGKRGEHEELAIHTRFQTVKHPAAPGDAAAEHFIKPADPR